MYYSYCVPCRLKQKEKDGPVKIRGSYGELVGGYQLFVHKQNFCFKHGGVIPQLELAYETWGKLNSERNNAVMLFAGLSASSHARSSEVGLATTSYALPFLLYNTALLYIVSLDENWNILMREY